MVSPLRHTGKLCDFQLLSGEAFANVTTFRRLLPPESGPRDWTRVYVGVGAGLGTLALCLMCVGCLECVRWARYKRAVQLLAGAGADKAPTPRGPWPLPASNGEQGWAAGSRDHRSTNGSVRTGGSSGGGGHWRGDAAPAARSPRGPWDRGTPASQQVRPLPDRSPQPLPERSCSVVTAVLPAGVVPQGSGSSGSGLGRGGSMSPGVRRR
jgi:hypothetical protein